MNRYTEKEDWWDELCKKFGEKNHFPPKKKNKTKNVKRQKVKRPNEKKAESKKEAN
jgi:hypothetical protein